MEGAREEESWEWEEILVLERRDTASSETREKEERTGVVDIDSGMFWNENKGRKQGCWCWAPGQSGKVSAGREKVVRMTGDRGGRENIKWPLQVRRRSQRHEHKDARHQWSLLETPLSWHFSEKCSAAVRCGAVFVLLSPLRTCLSHCLIFSW